MNQECLRVERVDLVFGNRPDLAFEELDRGRGRTEIQEKTQQVVAVTGASLGVRSGEILVLMGLSGSGKSSLLRCLNGMNGRDGHGALRGDVRFCRDSGSDVSIRSCSAAELRSIRRQSISMVFQQFGLMPWRTVYENVAYPLEVQHFKSAEIQERVLEKLKLVGLLEWKNRYPHELSGGMQQRVGLARAFVTHAPILLMDEPFSALDPLHRKHLQDEVLQLQRTLKKTIVFVSHDFSEALRLASRIAVMDSGRILQLGTPEEVLKNPSCEEVRRFTKMAATD